MSRIQPEFCWYFNQHPGYRERLLLILDQWHNVHREDHLRQYPNADLLRFDTYDQKHAHVGDRYIRLDVGGSGAWMLEADTGIIYGIKGYGRVDKKKIAGDITDPEFNGSVLFRDRFRHGRFDNRRKA